MVFYGNVIPFYRHVKHVFPGIVHSHLHFGWFLTRQLNLFLAEIVVLVRLTWLRLGFTSYYIFWKVPHLFTGVTFFVQGRTQLSTVWLTSTSFKQVTIAFITSELFTRFPEAFLKLYPTSFSLQMVYYMLRNLQKPLLDFWTVGFVSFQTETSLALF